MNVKCEDAILGVDSNWLKQTISQMLGKSESLRFRLARDTVGVMAIRALSMGLGFAVSVVLARLLGVRKFGLYSLAMSVLGLLVVPATFGFPQLLVREIAAYRVKNEWGLIRGLLRFAQRTSLLASLSIALLGGLALWLLSDRFSGETLQVLTLAFLALPFWALLQLHGEALRGFERILAGQWVSTVMRPLCFLTIVGVVWFFAKGFSNASLALGLQIIAVSVALAFAIILLRNQTNSFVPTDSIIQNTSIWVRSALSLALLTLLNLVPQHAGILMLGWMRNAEEVGIYKVAFQVASLLSFGRMGVNIVITPTLAKLYALGNRRKLQQVMIVAFTVATIFALPLVFLYIIKGMWLLDKIFGEAFVTGGTALIILTLGYFSHAVMGPVGALLVMSRHEGRATLSISIACGVNLLFNILLIPLWGIEGAAISYATTLAVWNFINLYFVFQILRVTRF